jgi:hypothetical protein
MLTNKLGQFPLGYAIKASIESGSCIAKVHSQTRYDGHFSLSSSRVWHNITG